MPSWCFDRSMSVRKTFCIASSSMCRTNVISTTYYLYLKQRSQSLKSIMGSSSLTFSSHVLMSPKEYSNSLSRTTLQILTRFRSSVIPHKVVYLDVSPAKTWLTKYRTGILFSLYAKQFVSGLFKGEFTRLTMAILAELLSLLWWQRFVRIFQIYNRLALYTSSSKFMRKLRGMSQSRCHSTVRKRASVLYDHIISKQSTSIRQTLWLFLLRTISFKTPPTVSRIIT